MIKHDSLKRKRKEEFRFERKEIIKKYIYFNF